MDLVRRNKHGWFLYMMEHKADFFDKGYCAIYLGDCYTIMFWKCA
jgi:hypothetical protein